jgi:hypothetical protein
VLDRWWRRRTARRPDPGIPPVHRSSMRKLRAFPPWRGGAKCGVVRRLLYSPARAQHLSSSQLQYSQITT